MEARMDSMPEPEAYYTDGNFFSRETAVVLAYFLLYSMGMFTLPFAAFFGTRHLLLHYMEMEGFAVTGWSVLSSVLMVNAIIMGYAYKGYQENVAALTPVPLRSQLNAKQD